MKLPSLVRPALPDAAITAPGGYPKMRGLRLGLAVLGAGAALQLAQAQTAPAAPATAAPPAETAAPATEPTGMQEIVITATRHAEVLSKVPVSVSAFSQETLDIKGVKDFNDIAKFTPGVTIDTNGTNSISIRGISASGGSGTTGIYIDDTPIQMRALGFNADDTLPKTFDLERVEVLRGPQGTLFGAGSEGGTVRYIMAQPNMNKSELYSRSEVSMTKGGTPSYEFGVAGGAPIEENVLGFRASLWYRHDGGYIDKIDPFTLATVESNSNYTNTVAGRLIAKWAVNDAWTITPSVLFQDRQTHDISVYFPIYSGGGKYRNADPDRRAEPDHYVLPALKVETELFGASLISNTSYYSRSDLSGYNGTEYNLSYFQTFNNPSNSSYLPFLAGVNYPLIDNLGLHLPASVQNYRSPATVTNKQKTFAQELRLQSNDTGSPLTWTTGLFYSVNKQTSIEEINDPMINQLFQAVFGVDGTAFFGYPLLANGDDYYNYNFSQDKQLAAFGEANYAVTSKLKLTVGARYSKTDVTFNHYADGPQNFGPVYGNGEQHEKPFTPKLGVSYQLSPSDMIYATYAKGFRIGGANAPIPTSPCAQDLANLGLSAAPDGYAADTVKSYEVGAKNKLGDRVRVASSVYYIQWEGIQQNIYLPGCGFQFTTNLGAAVAKGADLQAEWSATDALSFEVALGYTDSRYSEDVGSARILAKNGDAIVGASGVPNPPFTATIGTQYDFTAVDHKSFIRVDYEYASQNNWKTSAEDVRTGQYDAYAYTPKALSQVSMRLGTTIDKWNVSGFIENLFNAQPALPPSSYAHSDVDPYNANPPAPLVRNYTLRPRTIGVTGTYRF